MRPLQTSLALLAAVAMTAPALAQPDAGPPVTASQPVPNGPSPGIPGAQAVDPAPGATSPYVGAGRQGFYDVDARLAAVAAAAGRLAPSQRRRAMAQVRAIRSMEASQRARRGGELRDWDREAISQRLDALVRQYPGLQADAGAPPPPPGA